jgi:hypothetical protein
MQGTDARVTGMPVLRAACTLLQATPTARYSSRQATCQSTCTAVLTQRQVPMPTAVHEAALFHTSSHRFTSTMHCTSPPATLAPMHLLSGCCCCCHLAQLPASDASPLREQDHLMDRRCREDEAPAPAGCTRRTWQSAGVAGDVVRLCAMQGSGAPPQQGMCARRPSPTCARQLVVAAACAPQALLREQQQWAPQARESNSKGMHTRAYKRQCLPGCLTALATACRQRPDASKRPAPRGMLSTLAPHLEAGAVWRLLCANCCSLQARNIAGHRACHNNTGLCMARTDGRAHRPLRQRADACVLLALHSRQGRQTTCLRKPQHAHTMLQRTRATRLTCGASREVMSARGLRLGADAAACLPSPGPHTAQSGPSGLMFSLSGWCLYALLAAAAQGFGCSCCWCCCSDMVVVVACCCCCECCPCCC